MNKKKLNKYDKCFGLNLRLSLEYGLRELISRWKTNHDTSSHSSTLCPKNQINVENVQQTTKATSYTSSNFTFLGLYF